MWKQRHRSPKYRPCLVSLHPHYIFWITAQGCFMGHSLFLWLRQLCWAWYQCTHLESLSPSWQISGSLLSARGARFLKLTPQICLWMVMVYFRVTTLIDGRTALLATLCGSHSASSSWKGRARGIVVRKARILNSLYSLPLMNATWLWFCGALARGDTAF
jgi:hypothetical protein